MDFAAECAIAWDGAALAIVLFALPVAVVATALTLVLYRRGVAKAMRLSAGDVVSARASPQPPRAPPTPLEIVVTDARNESAAPRFEVAATRRLNGVYLLAGLAHSAVIVALYFWLNDLEFRPARALLVWLPFAWPLVLTMTLTAAATRRQKLALVGGYFAVLLAADAAADAFGLRYQPGFGELLLLWALIMGLPTLVIALLSNRAWRSVGLIALFFGLVLSAAYLLGFQALGCIVLSTRSEFLLSSFNVLLAGVVVLLLALAWWSLKSLVRRYTVKRYSDRMLVLDSWWLLVTAMAALFQLGASGFAGFVLFFAYAAYKAVASLGLRRVASRLVAQPPRMLLMLRVFGFNARTRRLLDRLAHYWRHVGPIGMIGGTDLASSLIEPDELMRFWSGRLRSSFVANSDDLAARLQTLDRQRDPDGRYRINEFFCHDNTWQATVHGLARRSAGVLMDLRGFGKENRGCEFELGLLLDEVPLDRVLLLVDRTTRIDELVALLQARWQEVAAASPNRAYDRPVLRLYSVEDSDADPRPLLSRLVAPTPG